MQVSPWYTHPPSLSLPGDWGLGLCRSGEEKAMLDPFSALLSLLDHAAVAAILRIFRPLKRERRGLHWSESHLEEWKQGCYFPLLLLLTS